MCCTGSKENIIALLLVELKRENIIDLLLVELKRTSIAFIAGVDGVYFAPSQSQHGVDSILKCPAKWVGFPPFLHGGNDACMLCGAATW